MNVRVELLVFNGYRFPWQCGVQRPAPSDFMWAYARHCRLMVSPQRVSAACIRVRRYNLQRTLSDMQVLETFEAVQPGLLERWLASAVSPALAG